MYYISIVGRPRAFVLLFSEPREASEKFKNYARALVSPARILYCLLAVYVVGYCSEPFMV